MIPRILHQVWKTDTIPERFSAYADSWRRHNPGWEFRFWSDRMLLDFVAEHYPALLPLYCAYPRGVMRADAARYMLLDHFGGVYADLDCECVAPFAPIMAEDRVVLCHEPEAHTAAHSRMRTLPHFLFNGLMASPAGHPFWKHVLAYLPRTACCREVLDATGPALLTSAQLSFDSPDALAIHPASLFAPLDVNGKRQVGPDTLSVHHWAGTWWKPRPEMTRVQRLERAFYKWRHALTRGPILRLEEARRGIDPACLDTPAPSGDDVAILVPLRDAADHIEPFLSAVARLDHPAEHIKLVFCEGDSIDDSWTRLREAVVPLRRRYREIVLLRKPVGTSLDRPRRWSPELQRRRRAGLAAVRNHLIEHGLDESDDWALWIDVDVWRFPSDIIARLTGTGRRIVVPDCTTVPGGPSFDLNSFATAELFRDHRYYRAITGGLYQPPANFYGRLHLSDLRHRDLVELHGVGGTMLLVDASLHRGGLVFPEKPYRELIETEGFGQLARDLGVVPVGLPQVEVGHVPW